nr:MAG TPA: hypothetical protein [Caudoviricetes sp.]
MRNTIFILFISQNNSIKIVILTSQSPDCCLIIM